MEERVASLEARLAAFETVQVVLLQTVMRASPASREQLPLFLAKARRHLLNTTVGNDLTFVETLDLFDRVEAAIRQV